MDRGFIRPAIDNYQFSWEIIFPESLIVELPEIHQLANKFAVSLADLVNKALILFPKKISIGTFVQKFVEIVRQIAQQ